MIDLISVHANTSFVFILIQYRHRHATVLMPALKPYARAT